MANKSKSKGLGRGLSALLADVDDGDKRDAGSSQKASGGNAELRVPIEKVRPNPDQPRRDFAPEDMEDLTASVKKKGIIQPLIVRVDPNDAGLYQIVAGERRWRAAQAAMLHEVPVLVRTLTDTEVLELAIIENIQRADLNAIEEAMGYRQLMDNFGHTQEQMAEALGKSRPHIANLLRLLNLPADVLDHVRQGRLSSGHARALITADDPSGLAKKIIAGGMSVREAERLAKSGTAPSPAKQRKETTEKDADTRAIESDLSAQLRMPVSIDQTAGGEGGKLTVKYKNLDQLDALMQLLSQ